MSPQHGQRSETQYLMPKVVHTEVRISFSTVLRRFCPVYLTSPCIISLKYTHFFYFALKCIFWFHLVSYFFPKECFKIIPNTATFPSYEEKPCLSTTWVISSCGFSYCYVPLISEHDTDWSRLTTCSNYVLQSPNTSYTWQKTTNRSGHRSRLCHLLVSTNLKYRISKIWASLLYNINPRTYRQNSFSLLSHCVKVVLNN